MEVCSDHQIIAGCFSHSGRCVKTCDNKTNSGCWDANMWGYVKECIVPRLSPPKVNEGWSPENTLSKIQNTKRTTTVNDNLKSTSGNTTGWILGILLIILIICLSFNWIFK